MWKWIKYLDRILRGEATQPSALRRGEIDQPTGGLAVIIMALAMVYGLCMGTYSVFRGGSSAYLAAFATVIKVPALFFLTLLVTFPSLYVFNALVGSRLSLLSVLRLLVISLAIMVTVLASLGPIVAFFSASTSSYSFMLVFNVVVFAISGIIGLRYMLITLNRLREASLLSEEVDQAAAELQGETALPIGTLEASQGRATHREVMNVFRIWMFMFSLAGGQMAWILRPFLGSPNSHFSLFRVRGSSFFEGILNALRHLF